MYAVAYTAPTMSKATQELRTLMKDHGLTRAAVAAHCGVAEVTVDSWLAPPEAKLHRKLNARHLMLLRLSLSRPRRRAS